MITLMDLHNEERFVYWAGEILNVKDFKSSLKVDMRKVESAEELKKAKAFIKEHFSEEPEEDEIYCYCEEWYCDISEARNQTDEFMEMIDAKYISRETARKIIDEDNR